MAACNANVICTRIHDVVQASGLNYIINQTPWSSYITIRKKFISSATSTSDHVIQDDAEVLLGKNKQLGKKITNLELEMVNLEEVKKVQNNQYQELVYRLHIRIETLENNDAALEKDTKVKDGIIQN